MSNTGSRKPRRAILLGVGLDSDGHKRITTGPNFALVGGSETTHDEMTEKAVKINEKLSAKGMSEEDIKAELKNQAAKFVIEH